MSKQTNPAGLWRHLNTRYHTPAKAKLITWSTVHVAPAGYEQFAPYIVAVVEFSDKTRACVQLTDVREDELSYGHKLKVVFRKMYVSEEKDVIPYGTKYTID